MRREADDMVLWRAETACNALDLWNLGSRIGKKQQRDDTVEDPRGDERGSSLHGL